MPDSLNTLRNAVRDVPDFPKPGILFKDITPLLQDPVLLRTTMDAFTQATAAHKPDKIAGIDARGFLFGATIADRLGIGFVPIRKKGKLPYHTHSLAYSLEYGSAEIEVHTDAFMPGERVALIDDLLATGGTASAAIGLISKSRAEVVLAQFLIELTFLPGRAALSPTPTQALLAF